MVRDVGAFSRFLEAISFSHGSMLNLSSVARDCQVSRNTVQGYTEVLEDLLLGFRIPVFTRRARRLLAQHPKFYFFDAGVFRSVRPTGPLDAPSELQGAGLEGLVAQHLRAWISYAPDGTKLHYWRTKSGSEVDFIIYGPRGFLALEVKNSRNVHRQDLRSLKSFRDEYPEAKLALLYRGTERLLIDGILCLPCEALLHSLTPGTTVDTLSAFE